MKLKAILVALPLAALAVLGGAALPAYAVESSPRMALSAAANGPSVTVHLDDGANGFQVAAAINQINEQDRTKFVQRVVDTAFEVSGKRFNVVLMNLAKHYDNRLVGKRLYANILYDGIYYGLWVAESGEFTNRGDGGFINWGFRGWYDRSGNTLKFRQP